MVFCGGGDSFTKDYEGHVCEGNRTFAKFQPGPLQSSSFTFFPRLFVSYVVIESQKQDV